MSVPTAFRPLPSAYCLPLSTFCLPLEHPFSVQSKVWVASGPGDPDRDERSRPFFFKQAIERSEGSRLPAPGNLGELSLKAQRSDKVNLLIAQGVRSVEMNGSSRHHERQI